MKREAKTVPTSASPAEPAVQEGSTNGTPVGIRYISAQKYQEIKRKVFTLHDGLLRRLAEHDRQR
ncbi:MAG: hypothetical protein LAQ69_25070 [Acidobacteriia bacterium]|nr:hypothetical protein [Terriglobia bacterium]